MKSTFTILGVLPFLVFGQWNKPIENFIGSELLISNDNQILITGQRSLQYDDNYFYRDSRILTLNNDGEIDEELNAEMGDWLHKIGDFYYGRNGQLICKSNEKGQNIWCKDIDEYVDTFQDQKLFGLATHEEMGVIAFGDNDSNKLYTGKSYIANFDTNGVHQWTHQFDQTENISSWVHDVSFHENKIIAGTTRRGKLTEGEESWMFYFNDKGQIIDSFKIQENLPYVPWLESIDITTDENIILTGTFGRNAVIQKISLSGEVLWEHIFKDTINGKSNYGMDIIEMSNQNIAVIYQSSSTNYDFGKSNAGLVILSPEGEIIHHTIFENDNQLRPLDMKEYNGNLAIICASELADNSDQNFTTILLTDGVNKVSIEEFFKTSNQNITPFPNPTTGTISLNFETLQANAIVTVRNSLGQIVSQSNQENINQLNLSIEGPKGLYLLEINDGEQSTINRVIKN